MVLELHVWGPAFRLPSIDPQCLAAIAYLFQVLPKPPPADSRVKPEWVIIASSNPLLSPNQALPALRDGTVWIAGFRGIVEYLKKLHGVGLDDFLNESEAAECFAFTTFIEHHGGALLDLSLYVSRQNFETVTRPLYSKLLPFPIQYFIPPRLRRAAKDRTEGLGISSLDIDPPPAPTTTTATPTTATPIPSILKSLGTTQPPAAAAFKLTALTTSFLESLKSHLGPRRYFFGDTPTTLDCIAVGYLSLFLYPELPHGFLADTMRTGFPRLAAYIHNVRPRFLGAEVEAEDVLLKVPTVGKTGGLPWGEVERGDLPWVGRMFLQQIKNLVPLSLITTKTGTAEEEEEGEEEGVGGQTQNSQTKERKKELRNMEKWETIKSIATITGGVAVFVAYVFWNGIITFQLKDATEETEEGEDGYAQVGSAEDILGLGVGGGAESGWYAER